MNKKKKLSAAQQRLKESGAKRCTHCKLYRKSTRRRANPYMQDVYGQIVRQNICDPCMSQLCDEV